MSTMLVIIAARNAGDFIETCIRSVCLQQVPIGWQLKVAVGVDACQATAKALRNTRWHRNIESFFFPERSGPYIIFNSLADMIPADILCRFDADDLMLPGHVAAQVHTLTTVHGADIVRGWSIYTDEFLLPKQAELWDGRRTYASGRRDQGSDGQFAMSRRVWNRLGGFRPWICNADCEFLVRARYAGFRTLDIRMYSYLRRVHRSSLTQSESTGYRSVIRASYMAFTEISRQDFLQGQQVPRLFPVTRSCFRIA